MLHGGVGAEVGGGGITNDLGDGVVAAMAARGGAAAALVVCVRKEGGGRGGECGAVVRAFGVAFGVFILGRMNADTALTPAKHLVAPWNDFMRCDGSACSS